MKTWQAILVAIATPFAGYGLGKITDPNLQTAAAGALAALIAAAGAAAKKNSDTNPDGKPATEAYVPAQKQ